MSEIDEHPEPVVVATHNDRGEAEVTKAHLADNGIAAEIIDEVAGGALPVDGESGVRVVVSASDVEMARSILDN
jgi:hypothetical protein